MHDYDAVAIQNTNRICDSVEALVNSKKKLLRPLSKVINLEEPIKTFLPVVVIVTGTP